MSIRTSVTACFLSPPPPNSNLSGEKEHTEARRAHGVRKGESGKCVLGELGSDLASAEPVSQPLPR